MKEFLLPYGKEKLTAKIEDEHLAGVLLSELHSYKAPKSGGRAGSGCFGASNRNSKTVRYGSWKEKNRCYFF